MADRETIITGGDGGGGIVAAVIIVVALLVGLLWFTGAINFNSAPASPITIEVPSPAPNVTVTTPKP